MECTAYLVYVFTDSILYLQAEFYNTDSIPNTGSIPFRFYFFGNVFHLNCLYGGGP